MMGVCLTDAWPSLVLLAPAPERTPSRSPKLSSTDDPFCIYFSPYLHVLVIRWKNTLFLGIDACFKLKLKDRGFDDPDLGTGLAYMVGEGPYQAYLDLNKAVTEEVSACFIC